MSTFTQPMFWAVPQVYRPQHVGLSLYTAPTVEPVSLAEVKAHLNLDTTAGEPAPTAPTVALVSVAGNVTAGAHRYLVTFVTADGETEAGMVSAAVTTILATAGQVTVSAIPIGGSSVTSRKVYRTAANGTTYLLLTTLANNTATTYTDNVADGSLGAQAPTTNTTSDPQLTSWITAARMFGESYTDRAFCTQTWRLTLSRWAGLPITLPKAPLQTVTSVTYIDSAGAAQTLATTEYSVEAPTGPYAEPGRLLPVYAPAVTPVTATGMLSTVTVQYVAGYGVASAVPQPLKQAMLLLIGQWYRNREAVTDGEMSQLPNGIEALLNPFSSVGLV